MKKIIFITIGIIFISGLVYYLFKPIESVIYHDYTINLKSDNIYVRTIVWGISGGHEAIAFSTNPIISNDIFGKYDPIHKEYEYNYEDDILVYYQPEIYYRMEEDTLFIYSISEPHKKLTENNNSLTIISIKSEVNEWYSFMENPEKYDLLKIQTY